MQQHRHSCWSAHPKKTVYCYAGCRFKKVLLHAWGAAKRRWGGCICHAAVPAATHVHPWMVLHVPDHAVWISCSVDHQVACRIPSLRRVATVKVHVLVTRWKQLLRHRLCVPGAKMGFNVSNQASGRARVPKMMHVHWKPGSIRLYLLLPFAR